MTINTVIVASGSGTDANAVMEKVRQGFCPHINLKFLLSTKNNAGCLDKAKKHNVPQKILDKSVLKKDFNAEFISLIQKEKIQLVFLLGCVVKIPHVPGVYFFNIHPVDKERFGGKNKYGLETHKAVLLSIKEELDNNSALSPKNKFFTYPTFHRVNENGEDEQYDSGEELLKVKLRIPSSIVENYYLQKVDLEESAALLQKYVLNYEWLMLPGAVNIAAQLILDDQKCYK
jgi:folate-dependent phosphoribosylglycinamide formyltransferase PurN